MQVLLNGLYSFVLGAFEDDDVTHIEGDVNPVRDLEIISEELRLKDEQNIAKALVYTWKILLHIYSIYPC